MNRRPDPKDRNFLQMIRDDLSAFFNFNPWTRAVSYLLILISLGVIVYYFLKWIVNVVVDLASTIQRTTPTLTPTPDLQLTLTPIPTIWVPPPAVDQFTQELFALDNLRHFLVIIFALILAFQLASAFYNNLYKIDKLSTSATLLLRSMFLIPLGIIVINEKGDVSTLSAAEISIFRLRIVSLSKRIQKAVSKKKSKKTKSKDTKSKDAKSKDDDAYLLRIGGPALVDIALGYGAVLKCADGEFRAIGPTGSKPAKIRPYEKLYCVIDLRDHNVMLDIHAHTRDGKYLPLKEAEFKFSVFRGRQVAQLADPYAFDSNALINLVCNYWREGKWDTFAQELIESDLRQFIATRMSSDISPQSSPNLFHDFVNEFNAQAQERGIQIWWTDKKWRPN